MLPIYPQYFPTYTLLYESTLYKKVPGRFLHSEFSKGRLIPGNEMSLTTYSKRYCGSRQVPSNCRQSQTVAIATGLSRSKCSFLLTYYRYVFTGR